MVKRQQGCKGLDINLFLQNSWILQVRYVNKKNHCKFGALSNILHANRFQIHLWKCIFKLRVMTILYKYMFSCFSRSYFWVHPHGRDILTKKWRNVGIFKKCWKNNIFLSNIQKNLWFHPHGRDFKGKKVKKRDFFSIITIKFLVNIQWTSVKLAKMSS